MNFDVSDRRSVRASSRRGVALAVALVAFVAAAAILFTILQAALVNQQRQIRDQQVWCRPGCWPRPASIAAWRTCGTAPRFGRKPGDWSRAN